MKRVAIPISNGRLSQYLGKCDLYEIFDINKNHVVKKEIIIPPVKSLSSLPEWAADQRINDIITYKVDKSIINLFVRYKINIFIGINLETSECLIKEYLDNNLKSDEKIIYEIIYPTGQ